MANSEHVAIFKNGDSSIRAWRELNPEAILDLSGADFKGFDFGRLDLINVDFSEADLEGASLRFAKLADVNLSGAKLSRTTWFSSWAHACNFHGANLRDSILNGAFFGVCVFSECDLTGARLLFTYLAACDMRSALLVNANLDGAVFNRPDLAEADVSGAVFGSTSFSGVDFSKIRYLDRAVHRLSSSIGMDSLLTSFRNAGKKLTPEMSEFFVSTGVAKEVLSLLPQIVAEVRSYSAFISYGAPDEEFALRLYEDLKLRGISCWLYDMDSTVGEATWSEIGRKQEEAEKVVVLCSAAALIRPGVLRELERQVDEAPNKFVPISLDNVWKEPGLSVMRAGRDLKPYLLERNYADFANLTYEDALDKLAKGLQRPALKRRASASS